MSSSELDLWEKYADQEPFGPLHDELRWGILISDSRNAQRAKKTAKKWGPADIFPALKSDDLESDVARFKAWAEGGSEGGSE